MGAGDLNRYPHPDAANTLQTVPSFQPHVLCFSKVKLRLYILYFYAACTLSMSTPGHIWKSQSRMLVAPSIPLLSIALRRSLWTENSPFWLGWVASKLSETDRSVSVSCLCLYRPAPAWPAFCCGCWRLEFWQNKHSCPLNHLIKPIVFFFKVKMRSYPTCSILTGSSTLTSCFTYISSSSSYLCPCSPPPRLEGCFWLGEVRF